MTYYGDTHVFTNQTNQANITIKAGKNENLVIEDPTLTGTVSIDIGSDNQVIYNDSETLVGSASFTYDGTDLSITGGIKTGNVYGTAAGAVINTIDLVNSTNQIDITAATGVKFSTDTESTSITTGAVQMLGGLGVSKTIFATKYSSPNGAFKFARFERTTNQAYTTPNLTSILYDTTTINEIPQLTYSSGTFTVSSATRLMVCIFVRYFSATNCSCIIRNTTTSTDLGSVTNSDTVFSNPGVGFSAIISLAASTNFVIQVYANTTGNIIGGTNRTYIAFYSLN